MKCSNCNNQIPDGINVCPYCSSPSAGQRICPSCKTPADSNAKFCRVCGTPIPTMTVQVPTVSKTSADKKNNTALVAIIAVMAVVIVGLLFCLLKSPVTEQFEAIQTQESAKTEESYDNAVTEEIKDDSVGADEYLFRSDIYEIDDSVLYGKSQHEVALIRNEIYARHGYIFTNPVYIEYFSAKSWYVPNPNFNETLLNDIEKRNKDFIVEYEIARGWR